MAAVCYRVNEDKVEFLLVQTRGGRWTFPKGHVEPGLTHAQSAALEAHEEAGVHGRMEEVCFSRYFLRSRSTRGSSGERKTAVHAHLCEVSRLEAPTEPKRNPTWFAPEDTKRRLKKGRTTQEAAELSRVVGRAVTRIQRLRDSDVSLPELEMLETPVLDGTKLELRKPDPGKKDALQKVEFTLVKNVRSGPVRLLTPMLRSRNN
ncbi:MAG TPA: NUDIX domain-containing protein [Terriglobales bacterium]|nr:NUDIX domain-containing protein [Terriglobales bacterium]